MRFTKCIWLLSFVFISLINLSYAQGNLGQAGANFLQIAPEPRGAALGGAGIATARGAAALYWNPAGAAHIDHNYDIVFSHTDWFIDTELAFGSIVANFGMTGAIGLSITSLYMDKTEITTPFASEGTGQYYDAGDFAFGLSYARRVTDNFTFGATVKYVHEFIWNETASTLAFDIGSIYQTNFLNLRLGIAILNIAGKMKFEGDDIDNRIREEEDLNIFNNPRLERFTPEFRLPQVFQIGIAFEPFRFEENNLTIMTDVNAPSDNEQRVVLGFEYGFRRFAFLRAAYNLNYDDALYSFGAGLNVNMLAGLDAQLNYSYSEHDTLSDIHRFGLGVSF